ncbi:MAG: 50S ribosomal protein L22 [Candidatus Omnitrophica bacterium]|nr:50S ribosomal protein L22 [Candidatus Omnitrophota bacterium]
MAKSKTAVEAEVKAVEKKAAKVVLKYLRISPRKVRAVLDAIRHKPVHKASAILKTLNKKAAGFADKALKSAVANAKVLGMDEGRLVVADVRADGGPVFKRFMSRSMGRADRLLKRTTHLSLSVSEGARSFAEATPEEKPGKEKVTATSTAKKKAPAKSKKSAASAK